MGEQDLLDSNAPRFKSLDISVFAIKAPYMRITNVYATVLRTLNLLTGYVGQIQQTPAGFLCRMMPLKSESDLQTVVLVRVYSYIYSIGSYS